MVIEALVKTVLSELRQITKTENVVGDAISVGETTIVPVSKITVGFAVGGGKKDSKNGGGGEGTGGGATIEPLAFFVVRGEKVDLVTIKKEDIGLSKFIDLVPQIVEKVKEYKEKKGKNASKSEEESS